MFFSLSGDGEVFLVYYTFMLGILFFFLSCGAGVGILRKLPLHVARSEWLIGGSLLGIVGATWISFLGVTVLDYTWGLLVTGVLVAGIIGWSWRGNPSITLTPDIQPKLGWQYVVFWGSMLGIAAIILKLLFTHFLPVENGIWYRAGYTWADLALHMSLAASFAHATSFTMDFSLLHGTSISYPFLVDFLTGMLVRLGLSWQLAFLLPSILFFAAFIRLTLSLGLRLYKSLRAAWLHLAIILASGSAWGLVMYFQDISSKGWKVFQTQDYTNLDLKHLQFANLLTSHLLPQRSYLFGISIFLLMLLFLMEWHAHRNWKILVGVGILCGLLPFIHVHTFFIATAVAIGVMTWVGIEERKLPYNWWLFLMCLCIALPQLGWQFIHAYHSHFTSVEIGWLTPPGMSMVTFWVRNLGLALPLILCVPFMVRAQTNPVVKVMAGVGAVLFIVGNLYSFQPNVWDNMKFFTYAYVCLMLPVAGWLAKQTYRLHGIVVVGGITLLLTGSGILAIAREFNLKYTFLVPDDTQFADYITTALPSDTVLLTTDAHHNPIPVLTGRPIILGYRGWLWSYGVDYREREQDVATMLAGGPQTEMLFQKYGIQYVAFNAADHIEWSINDNYYQTYHHLVAHRGTWFLYGVENIGNPPQ
jgi:hypothetical protein